MLRALIFGFLVLLAFPDGNPAQANDVDVAKRGVTRVIVATELSDGRSAQSFGSGFAVGPDKIVTNAHVVRLARQYPRNSLLVVVPSEGSKPFLARIEAYDAGKDLALLTAINANLPPLTIFSGTLESGTDVATLGYPGNVDQATIRSIRGFITPQEPVLAEGNFSNIRDINNIEALIHNANIARGNSGGPLVDECGRVLGVNTFQTANESGDSSFAFASSARELMRFLRRAGVTVQTIAERCITAAEFAAIETERKNAEERAQKEEADRLAAEQREAEERAKEAAEREISAEREQLLFLAMALLVGGALAIGGGLMVISQGKGKKQSNQTMGVILLSVGALLIFGGLLAFLQRPELSDREIKSRIQSQNIASTDSESDSLLSDVPADEEFVLPHSSAKDEEEDEGAVPAANSSGIEGDLICVIDRSRSRITTTVTDDIPFNWKNGGCVNGQTQYARTDEAGKWSRLLVPNQDRTVSRLTFSPDQSELVLEKYALSLSAIEDVRDMRAQIDTKSCTASDDAIDRLGRQQAEIDAILPQYSEKLVYNCR